MSHWSSKTQTITICLFDSRLVIVMIDGWSVCPVIQKLEKGKIVQAEGQADTLMWPGPWLCQRSPVNAYKLLSWQREVFVTCWSEWGKQDGVLGLQVKHVWSVAAGKPSLAG